MGASRRTSDGPACYRGQNDEFKTNRRIDRSNAYCAHDIRSDESSYLGNQYSSAALLLRWRTWTLNSTFMAEEIRISPDGTYILVSSVGSPSLGEMMQTLSKIAELRRDHSIDKVLVDSRTRSGQPPVADLYRGGELLAEKLGFGTRIAVLVSQLAADHTLFENVAVNRGVIVAYFQHEDVALRWLFE
jgi:hypothetical protein